MLTPSCSPPRSAASAVARKDASNADRIAQHRVQVPRVRESFRRIPDRPRP
jgi:hypothetical protein